ncbi:MAG: DUF4352 domain-containing protein [Acidobacteriia bacterium]|nr:DUF4352 domain-containing protein [Terriglobia bacterium]
MNSSRIVSAVTGIAAVVFLFAGCSSGGAGRETVRPMGDAVPVGALIYTVLDVEWKNDLSSGVAAKLPQNRFAIVRLSINNAGSQEVSVPLLNLEDAGGKSYPELTELEGFADWLGLLRVLNPGESQQGQIVFDVAPGEYRLRVSSSGDPEKNETALVGIPVSIPRASELPAPAPPAARQ